MQSMQDFNRNKKNNYEKTLHITYRQLLYYNKFPGCATQEKKKKRNKIRTHSSEWQAIVTT